MIEKQAPLVMGAGPRLPRPSPTDLCNAFTVLTPLPGLRPDLPSPSFARATLFFPVVGLVVGAFLVSLNSMAASLPSVGLTITLSLLWMLLSWPLHTPVARSTGERCGLAACFLAKVLLLNCMPDGRAAALLFSPVLGRWAIVVLAIGARDADHPGRKLNSSIAFAYFGWSSVFAGGVLSTIGDAAGILVFVATAAFVLGLRLVAHRLLHGFTWRTLCMAVQAVEVFAIVLVALL